jgi:hypothetical protein
MIKKINQLLYFFGYAPIKVRQEVKYYFAEQRFTVEKLEAKGILSDTIRISSKEFEQRVINELVNELKQKAGDNIIIEMKDNEITGEINYTATLLVAKLIK